MCSAGQPGNLHPSELLHPVDHIHHSRLDVNLNDASDHEEEDDVDNEESSSDKTKSFQYELKENGHKHVDETNTFEHCCFSAGEVGCNDLCSRCIDARDIDLLLLPGDDLVSLKSLCSSLSLIDLKSSEYHRHRHFHHEKGASCFCHTTRDKPTRSCE